MRYLVYTILLFYIKLLNGHNLTVVITASLIPSHPDIRFIKQTIESLRYIHKPDIKVILAHDYHNDPRYAKYLYNLQKYIANKKNIHIVKRNTHGCLTGNVRHAVNYVNTKYMLLMQHDLPFVRDIDMNKVIEDMQNHPQIKHLRFSYKPNAHEIRPKNKALFGTILQGKHYQYMQTAIWSDQNHLTTVDYYKNVILPKCPDGNYMEHTLFKIQTNKNLQDLYGTYLFGNLKEGNYVKHTNGRQGSRKLYGTSNRKK